MHIDLLASNPSPEVIVMNCVRVRKCL